MPQSPPQTKNQTNLETELKHLVCTHLGVLPEQVTPEIPLSSLGANALDQLELFIAIEKKFSAEIDLDSSQTLLCVGDIARYLKKQKGLEKGLDHPCR